MRISKPVSLENEIARFSLRQLANLLANMYAIQLTDGCSVGCKRCGAGAKKGIDEYIPFDFLKALISEHSDELKISKPILYHASDPMDYDFDGKDIVDLHRLLEKQCGFETFISTSNPPSKKDPQFFNRMMRTDRITVNQYNFRSLIKRGVLPKDFKFPKEPEVIIARVRAEDPGKGVCYFHDVDIDIHLYKPPMKRKLSIMNHQGVVLTPEGFFNMVVFRPCQDYPYGFIMEKIEPDDFRAIYHHNTLGAHVIPISSSEGDTSH